MATMTNNYKRIRISSTKAIKSYGIEIDSISLDLRYHFVGSPNSNFWLGHLEQAGMFELLY